MAFVASQAAFAQQDSDAAASAETTQTTRKSASEKVLPAVTINSRKNSNAPLEQDVSSGALGTRSQLDTPFSTTIVTGEQLADRQASKLGDVFFRDASASDNSNPYNAWASYVTVRGMQLDWQNGFKIDGQPYNGYGITMPYEQLERVELLKGLSGFMYGFGAPGGVVNYVTLKPPVSSTPVRSIDVGYHSTGIWSEHLDLGGRVGPNDMLGYRFNATHEEGKTYNDGNVRRNSFSLAADLKITRDLSATFGALYQERHTSGITTALSAAQYTGTALPGRISGGSSTIVTPDQHLNTNLQVYTTGLRYNLNDDWSVSGTYSFSKSTRDRNESTYYLLDSAGNYNDTRYGGKEGHQFGTWQVMAEGNVKTGPLSHQIVVGGAYQTQHNDNGANTFYSQIGVGNIYQANTNRYEGSGFYTYRNSDVTQKAIFASDTIQLTQRWSVLGGLRYTNYDQKGYALDGTTTSSYSQNGVLTPTVALMFKLEPTTTLYASYVESLEAGTVVGTSYANSGELLKPLRSKQYEIGVKSERERWSASAALFRIERGSQYANSANVYVQDGESVFQGIEAGTDFRLGRDWSMGGDLMWIATQYKRGSSNNGNRVAGAPGFVAAAHVNYAVAAVPGLKLGVDAKFTGNTSLNPSASLNIPGYLLMNLGATYSTRIAGHGVTLRAALDNVLNRRYWEFQYADYIAPGEPRTLSLNAKVEF
ncbi:TonB-dependent siderophore receptor [Paraburkholderia bonniea]|uniref:TonB-dependent siderophore receptor n=1 Tax=Paraburkholderia bonniea TaxID=2152891 RepID=UPI001FE68ECA|nr:TonB-dependent siderophore receptor [Paraburkholderia bonniea]WJF91344.1 TonB-dependent siderophore receptor [Paraburkholderia bonniea]WJF94659.1 TonB-dependent siderophore receptor [Paraburkholderia bonniea]